MYITPKQYQTILQKDLTSLSDLVLDEKYFNGFIERYSDTANVEDALLYSYIDEDLADCLALCDIPKYVALNAFKGCLKKNKIKFLRKNRK
jgi:hypothetical protein